MARLLFLFGIGFLVANVLAITEQIRYWRRRRSALLTWPALRPPFYAMQIGIGVAVGLLFFFNLLVRPAAAEQLFGEGMMLVYYGYVVPASTRLERGFYRDGIWSDRRFVPYARVHAISWREGKEPVLLIASGFAAGASRLNVPIEHYGGARRVLRDLIATHAIHLEEAGLHLGTRDERDSA